MKQDTSSPAYLWARHQERLEAEAQAKAQAELAKIVREAALYRELVASGTIKEQSEMISGALSATLNVSAGIQPQFAAAALTVTAD